LILDRAIEDELMETIQTMDRYVAVEGLYRSAKTGKVASQGGQSEAAAPHGISLPLSRQESQTAAATAHSQQNQDLSVNDSIYDI